MKSLLYIKLRITLHITLHVVSLVLIATLVSALYAIYNVYYLDHLDPKFGPSGTVWLNTFIAFVAASATALGSSCVMAWRMFNKNLFFQSACLKHQHAIWLGVLTGATTALCHSWVLNTRPC